MKAIQRALHYLAYLIFTVLMTCAGVTAWALSVIWERKKPQSPKSLIKTSRPVQSNEQLAIQKRVKLPK